MLVYESALGMTAPRPNWSLVSTDAAERQVRDHIG